MRWLLLFTLAIFGVFANVMPIESIRELTLHGRESGNVLVVFDIDDTLTILSDPVYHRPNFKIHHAQTLKEIMSPLSEAEQAVTMTIPLLTTPSDLIELEAPEWIEELQQRGFKTIALTASMGGEIEGASIEDRRISELMRVGIDFSRSFPEIDEIVLPGFEIRVAGRTPFYKNGVIFTNETDKGVVLVEFLKCIAWKPDLVLFVDDRTDHLHAVKKALDASFPEIQFRGFHFQSASVPYKTVSGDHFKQKWMELAEKANEDKLKKVVF